MIHRTLREAYDEPRPFAGWVEKVIHAVTLEDGRVFYRTTQFDSSWHKCKRCRKAESGRYRGPYAKLPSTGHVCECCGNPYAGFVRRTAVRSPAGAWSVIPDGSWASSGRLH